MERDFKSELNELKQKLFGEEATIEYRRRELPAQSSSSTDRRWAVTAICVVKAEGLEGLSSENGDTLTTDEPKKLGEGEGDTPIQAEQAAAQMAYKYLMESYAEDLDNIESSG